MSTISQSQAAILQKLQIQALNPMQLAMQEAMQAYNNVVLLSPTGTGKTLAFLLPIIEKLDRACKEVQVLLIAPSRELVLQMEQVTRTMGTGYKVNAVYGGQSFNKDKINLKHRPAILLGTPGRVADHLRRGTFSTEHIITLVLDEFDKSLEIGFEREMIQIIDDLPNIKKRILTSATQQLEIPAFVGLQKPTYVNYLGDAIKQLSIKAIISPDKDKLDTLVNALRHLGNQPGIIFCNYKASIQRISEYLTTNNIAHGCFYGGMEQQDRERSLIKFRNGSHQLLLATDLAARGLDIPTLKFILHYQLPRRKEEFVHRNGRTARMNKEGTAYVLYWEHGPLPYFIKDLEEEVIQEAPAPPISTWVTVFISGGRKDKISKGDIVGLFLKKGELAKEELGIIEIKQDCAFVAVHRKKAKKVVELLDNNRLKKKKIRMRILEK